MTSSRVVANRCRVVAHHRRRVQSSHSLTRHNGMDAADVGQAKADGFGREIPMIGAGPPPAGGWYGRPPYRHGPAWAPPPPAKPSPRPAPFRVKELAAAIGIALACD